MPKRMRIVEADPRDGDEPAAEAAKPGVDEFIGRAGFPGQIGAPELHGAGGGAHLDHVLHHVRHDERIAGIDCALGRFAGLGGPRLDDDVALESSMRSMKYGVTR